MVTTASTSDAAPLMPSAAAPPAATRLPTAALVTSKPAIECPALIRLSDIGKPILPRPMKPMRAMVFLPDSRSRWALARRHHRESDIGEYRRQLAEHDKEASAVNLGKEQLDRCHGDRRSEPPPPAPRRGEPQAHRGDEIDHRKKHGRGLPRRRTRLERRARVLAEPDHHRPMIEAFEQRERRHRAQEPDQPPGPQ